MIIYGWQQLEEIKENVLRRLWHQIIMSELQIISPSLLVTKSLIIVFYHLMDNFIPSGM